VEYGLTAKPDDPIAFAAQVPAVCEVDQHAPAIAEHGGPVSSTDEKTGIQALERAAPTWPMRPGLVERPASAYLRHGPQGLIAHVDVATGEVVAPTVGPRRTEADVAGPIAPTLAPDPEAPWLFLVDPRNRHTSEALVRLVADACGIKEELGEKAKRGLLQSMSTRAEFLRDVRHRIPFLSTPKHTSWLNHIARWFSLWVRRLLRRGNFTSVED
jgi:hypothetical protein